MTLCEIIGIYLVSLKILTEKGISFIANTRKNMKSKVIKFWDRLMFRKQLIIKTVFNQLKNIS
ncbi:transposase [Candidatus Enterovibrio escicola]|uniref:transposase n=1 Tax=Candidatus Enterovibrio escicola TaxID=1927127 RepID=UPI0012381A0B